MNDSDVYTDDNKQGERYAYSRTTDTWYRVTAWREVGIEKIQAISKEQIDREEVPQPIIDAMNEQSQDTDTDRDGDYT